MTTPPDLTAAGVIWDVHAHYLPESAIPPMGRGQVQVATATVNGIPDSITVNGIVVGATVQQLSDIESIVGTTDRQGLHRRVLSPPPFTYRYWDDPLHSLELSRLLNDATAIVVEAHPDRFVGLATVPLQDTEAAIGELRRARDELGLVGVTLGTNVAGANVSDEVRVPFLAEVAEIGMPLLIHPDFVPNPRISGYYLVNVLGMPVDSGITMANMMFSGLFDRLPDLRVCFMHGGGIAPYLFGRWDKAWQVRREAKVDAARKPTDYLDNIFCDTLTHSPQALSYLVDVMGERNVVLGTDLPFDVEDDDPRGHVRRAPRLTEDQIEVIERVSPVRWLTGKGPVRFHRFEELEDYLPEGHEGVVNRLLVGEMLGGEGEVSVWHGRLAPGGHSETHTHPGSLQIYIGVTGEMVVGDDETEETLTPLDTAVFPKGTLHFIENRTDEEAEVLVISVPALR